MSFQRSGFIETISFAQLKLQYGHARCRGSKIKVFGDKLQESLFIAEPISFSSGYTSTHIQHGSFWGFSAYLVQIFFKINAN